GPRRPGGCERLSGRRPPHRIDPGRCRRDVERARVSAPPTGRAPDTAADFADWIGPEVERMARLAARLAPTADRDDIVQGALRRALRESDHVDPTRGTP